MNSEDRNTTPSNILIGTSGYSYPDWRGFFYPSDIPQSRFLEYYMRYFPTVEINYTFYCLPDVSGIEKLVTRSEGQLQFTVKAHREFTHRDCLQPGLDTFFAALRPMEEAGVLTSVLFQFPFSFRQTPANWQRLNRLQELLGDIQGVMEFRHNSWLTEETFSRLKSLGLAYCCVDEPDLPGLPGRISRVTSPLAYLRFHGRNNAKWWDHEQAWERYDYLYRPEELVEWIPRVKQMQAKSERVQVFFNNHYQGQAVRNAQLLMAFLAE